jgi:tetratricopeptide (TPR) repeat protein
MVGAGLSCPSVPLAPDIVSKCKEVAQRYGRGNEAAEKSALDAYSYWFQTANAEPKQRQKYLQDLMREKPITHANFRLAHLLLSNKISNLVVTTNFDDFLAKALTLFGEPYITCDHPQTVRRINHNDPLLQIVHLHGSYWFYDCCNLRGELEERAQQSQLTTSTMASLLNVIMWDRSPLVIGYSGWEGDVFMEALKRRLATPLGSNVYWFCYSKSTVDPLPAWARENPNIWFVIPAQKPVARTEASESDQTSGSRAVAGGIQAKGPGVKKDDEPVLPADTVLHRLIQAFNLDAPELTKDPLGFFASRLESSLPISDASDAVTDTYAIKSVIERVRTAKRREQETDQADVKPSASALEQVRDAVRRADFREAIRQAEKINLATLTDQELDELAEAMWSAATGLVDNSEEEIVAYDLIVDIWNQVSARPGTKSAVITKVKIARALALKGISLGALNRSDEEIAAYDEAIERFGDSDEPEVKQEVADALFAKAASLEKKQRLDEAVATYDQLVQKYEAAPEIELQARVARALLAKGAGLGDLGKTDEEMKLYDLVIQRYGPTPDLQNETALAVFSKAYRLAKLDEGDAAIALYDHIINKFGTSTDPELGGIVAKARFNKSNALGATHRIEEALAVCTEIIETYSTSSDPMLLELASDTLNSMAFNLLILAKADRLSGNEAAALSKLQSAEGYIVKSLEKDADNPMKLGNQGYIAFLLGRKDEARRLLTRAITLGGEKIRQGELNDAFINELPEDPKFRELVNSIPLPV